MVTGGCMTRRKITVDELEKFKAWLKSVYGPVWFILQPNTIPPARGTLAEYAYKDWVSQGRPEPKVEEMPTEIPYTDWSKTKGLWSRPIGPEQPTPEPTGPPDVISQGGFDWVPIKDLEGNIVSWELIGRTPSDKPSYAEQRDWTLEAFGAYDIAEKARKEREAAEQTYKLAKSQARMNVVTPSMMAGEQYRAGAYKAYESARQEILNMLTDPADWIKRWQVEHTPNPYYQPPGVGVGGGFAGFGIDPELIGTQDPEGLYKYEAKSRGGVTWMEKVPTSPEAQAYGAEYAGWRSTQPGPWAGPKTPPTPRWLAPLTGQAVGTPIKKNIKPATPSPQLWQTMKASEKAGLAGYAGWTGGDIEDIVNQMQMMKPRQPSLRTRWRPPEQRGWA